MAVTETTTAVRAYGLPALGRVEGTGGSGLGTGASSVGGWPQGQRITYSYDDADRLTDAQYDSADRYQYAYDPVGNRTALTVTAQSVETQITAYAYDDADRLTSVDGVPFTYDNRGNLTGDGAWTYTYNAAGRMVRAASITATMVYTYSGDGLLVAEARDGVETRLTWDQAIALPQVLATSEGEREVYGLQRIGVLQDEAWYYPQTDALGSVRQWTDALRAVAGLQAYGPYGEALVPLGSPLAAWGYTGEWADPAGLVYLRARWYNPGLGGFTQMDVDHGAPRDPGDLSRFAYVGASPLNATDPSGHDAPWWLTKVLAGQMTDYDWRWLADEVKPAQGRATLNSVGGVLGIAVPAPLLRDLWLYLSLDVVTTREGDLAVFVSTRDAVLWGEIVGNPNVGKGEEWLAYRGDECFPILTPGAGVFGQLARLEGPGFDETKGTRGNAALAYEGPSLNYGLSTGIGLSYLQSFDVNAPGPRLGVEGQPSNKVSGLVWSWGEGVPFPVSAGVYSDYAHPVLDTQVPAWFLLPCRIMGACGGF